MRARIQVPAILAEHEIVADIERTSTEKSTPIVRMLPASTGSLSRHVTGELGFVEIVGAYEFEEREIGGSMEWLEGVHNSHAG